MVTRHAAYVKTFGGEVRFLRFQHRAAEITENAEREERHGETLAKRERPRELGWPLLPAHRFENAEMRLPEPHEYLSEIT
jgi:hypothetical protein